MRGCLTSAPPPSPPNNPGGGGKEGRMGGLTPAGGGGIDPLLRLLGVGSSTGQGAFYGNPPPVVPHGLH